MIKVPVKVSVVDVPVFLRDEILDLALGEIGLQLNGAF
jgi:hypothetical protein